MAKRTTISKALGYQESFFANRNDMLQSALDAVLLKIDNEQARYQAEVELYKEASKLVTRERERLQKTVDSLKKAQIDKDLAVAQFNAGQKNSTARTSASIEAANARFNAKQAALAAYYGSRGFSAGRDPSDQVTVDQARQAFTANPNDINAGFRAYLVQARGTSGVPKTDSDIQKGLAIQFTEHVDKEFGDPKYNIFDDPKDRLNAAKDTVLERIADPADRARVELGLVKLNPQGAAGAGLVIDSTGNVSVGGIDVQTIGQVDYSGLIADTEARLGRIKEAEAKAPVAPKEPDLIDLQRREYFDKFYSGYVPRYEMNEIMQKLIDLPDADAQAFKDLYQSRYSPVAGMETPTGARRVRDLPTTPGGVIGGEGSPFVPEESPLSDKALRILSNKGANQFFGEGLSDAQIQSRAQDLFTLGLGLTKVTKEDGKVLYTVVPFDRLGTFKPEDVVMPIRSGPDMLTGAEQALLSAPEKDMRLAQQNVRMGEGEPFNPAKYDAEIVALTGDLDRIATNLGFLKETAVSGTPEYDESRRLESEYAVKDNRLNDLLMRRGNMQAKVDAAGIEPRRLQPVTGDQAEVRRIQPTTALQARRRAPMDYDQSELAPAPAPAPPRKKIDLGEQEQVSDFEISKTQFVEDPTNADYRYRQNEAGGFDVEFKGQPAKPAEKGSGAAKAIESVLTPRKVIEEIKIESKPTPQQTDAKVKFDAAEKAQSIYGTPEFNKLLNTELGRAVSDLYSVNKAKGDETGGEVLSYIATEFPRAEDQSKAAQILMGLSYADKTKGLLKS